MTEIRASEIKEQTRIQEPGENEIFVASVDQQGDTVLIADRDGTQSTFDRDTVVELLPARLACPACGEADGLTSWEMDLIGYPVRLSENPGQPSEPAVDYRDVDAKYGEGGTGFVDDLQCGNHVGLLELTTADLVPEGTPTNPIWQWPADRPTKVRAEDALDQIATRLSDSFWGYRAIQEVADIVRTTGRTLGGHGTGRAHG